MMGDFFSCLDSRLEVEATAKPREVTLTCWAIALILQYSASADGE